MGKLPKKIKVGPYDYTIRSYVWKAEDDQIGGCDTQRLVLSVDDSGPAMVTKNTLLHEVLHAVYDLYDLGPDDSEEDVVMRLSNGLQMVMVDNPGLGKYLW